MATSRDINGSWVGVDPIQAEEELNELQSLKLSLIQHMITLT